MLTSYTLRGPDGNDLTVSETVEGGQVVISIQSNDRQGGIGTVRLTHAQWSEFCELKYKVEVSDRRADETEAVNG